MLTVDEFYLQHKTKVDILQQYSQSYSQICFELQIPLKGTVLHVGNH